MSFYPQIFLEAVAHGFLIPLSPLATLFAMQGFGGGNVMAGFALAVAGGTLGQMINYALGCILNHLRKKGTLYIRQDYYEATRRMFQRFFLPTLLFSWWGLGGIFPLAAGVLAIRWWWVAGLIAIGQAGWLAYELGWITIF